MNAYKEKFEVQIYDSELIERVLLENREANKLIERFFPETYNKLHPKPVVNLLGNYQPLRCKVCGKDLLQMDIVEKYHGILVFTEDRDYFNKTCKTKITGAYCVCKGDCDRAMEYIADNNNQSTSWEDISDLVIPYKYLQFIMAIMNNIRDEMAEFTDEAYEDTKNIIIQIGQIALRAQKESDIARIKELLLIPEGL